MLQTQRTIFTATAVVAPAEVPPLPVLAARPAPSHYDLFRATKKFGSLDGLRCISILAVIWSHAGNGAPGGPLASLPIRGGFGVDLFFIISGFLITTLLLREQDATGSVSLKGFYIRRTLRIFPLYFAVLGANIAFVTLAGRGSSTATQFWHDLPYFLTYTYNWVDPFCTSHGTFGLSWSLATEEQFYLVWPMLFVFAPRSVQLAALAAVISLDIAYSFPAHEVALAQQPFVERFLAGLSTPICLGVAMALVLHARRGFDLARRALAHRMAAPIFLAALLGVLSTPDSLAGRRAIWCVAWIAAWCLVGACVVREDNGLAKILRWRPIAWMGLVSYGLYLLHPLANSAAMRLLPKLGLTSDFGIVRFLAVIPLSCLLAAVSYHLFEKQFLRLKDRFTPARDRAPAPAVAHIPTMADAGGWVASTTQKY